MLASLIIQLTEKVTKPAKAVQKAISGIGKEGKKAASGVEATAKAAAKIDDKPAGRLSRMLTRLREISKRPLIVRTAVDEKATLGWAKRFGSTIGTTARRAGQAIKAGLAFGLIAAGGFTFLLKKIIDVGKAADKGFAAKFEAATTKLSSHWTGFLLKIGKAGVFDLIIGKLNQLNAWIERMTANGQLDKWANDIAGALKKLSAWLDSIDWKGVGSDVLSIGRGMGKLVGWISKLGGGGLGGIFNIVIVGIIGKIAFSLYGLASALGVVSVAGAPLWLVVGIIAAIAAGAFLVYRNWDKISAWFAQKWEQTKAIFANAGTAIVNSIKNMWARAKASFSAGVSAIWNSLPGWMRGIFNGATFSFRAIGNLVAGQGVRDAVTNAGKDSGLLRVPPRKRINAPRTTAQVGGSVDVRFLNMPAPARVTRNVAVNQNVPTRVNVGKVRTS